jgi:hypothetical protein
MKVAFLFFVALIFFESCISKKKTFDYYNMCNITRDIYPKSYYYFDWKKPRQYNTFGNYYIKNKNIEQRQGYATVIAIVNKNSIVETIKFITIRYSVNNVKLIDIQEDTKDIYTSIQIIEQLKLEVRQYLNEIKPKVRFSNMPNTPTPIIDSVFCIVNFK